MINFDFLTLTAFIEENIDFLMGARLQKIQQPTRQELVFGLRNLGETRKFYININPKFFHVCFMSGAEQSSEAISNEKKRYIEIPKKPPMFCMLLRKYLEGAKIAKVCQPEQERILEFYFETYNETSEKIYLCLAIELMGKHSNVVLYNYDTNVIIGCAHNVGAEKSREREIIGGLPYAYPPRHNNTDFSGFSQFLKDDISVNETIDNYFADLQEKEKIKLLKLRLFSFVKAKLKKINNALEKSQKQLSKSENGDLCRKKGDLIMANLFHGKDFSPYIEVVDYETNSPIKIELDETKTLKENANQYFKLYNKSKTAYLKAQEMTEDLQREKDYLEQVLYSLENANNMEDLLEIKEELGIDKIQNKEKQKKRQEINILTKKNGDFTVYIGKNNKQNDYIVSKLSRDEDIWFHVHNCAGSHVLLRVEAGQEVTDEIIFECAKLAKEYSIAKNSSKVGVIYTKRKFLKKPPAANLGYVIYKGEKEIIID